MADPNQEFESIRAALAHIIRDEAALLRLRKKFGPDILKGSTLRNWIFGHKAKVPDGTVEGALLGLECLNLGLFPGDPTGGLEGVPSSILSTHPHSVRTTWLWAKRMWNILDIQEPQEQGARTSGRAWRMWEDVNLLRNRPDSWVVHSSRSEASVGAGSNVSPFAEELIPVDLTGAVIETNSADGMISFSRKVLQNDEHRTFGYKFVASEAFATRRSENTQFEFFGGQACIPCEEFNVLVSLPKNCIDFDLFQPFLRAASFAPISIVTPLAYVRQVVERGFSANKQDDRLVRQGFYATWATPNAAHQLYSPAELLIPEVLRDAVAKLFTEEKFVFLARFPVPNPLTFQSVFWRLPAP